MSQYKLNKQSGFMVLITMVVLVVGATVWFGSAGHNRSELMKINTQDQHMRELQRIKERMLTYAVMQPEIFSTDSNDTDRRAQEDIPGLGYFPCPDTNGDGNSNSPCAGIGIDFVIGMVPESISSRYYTFIDKPSQAANYWYAVDERFLTQNSKYNYDSEPRRYVPLNTTNPSTAAPTANLTLDGVDDIVMVLFYAGAPVGNQTRTNFDVSNYLDHQNSAGPDFISSANGAADFNDYVIPITRKEWNAMMLSRVEMDADNDGTPDLCNLDVDDAHWFNACRYVGNSPPFACTEDNTLVQNIYGQDWRTEICP